jgi:TRAP-type transport system small permease protein
MRKKSEQCLKILEYICGFLLLIMLGCVLIQVVFRGIFDLGFSWTEELARYTMIWLTYVGAVVCLLQGSHIAIDLLIKRFPEKWQNYTKLISNMLIFFFLFMLFREGRKLVSSPIISRQLTPGLGISTSYLYSVIPIGVGMMMIVLAYLIVIDLKNLFRKKVI